MLLLSSSTLLRRARHLSTAVATTTSTNATSSATMTISEAESKLLKEHDADKALDIYSTVKSHHSSSNPGLIYRAQLLTVRRLAKSHRFADIEALIESHKNDPQVTDENFLSLLIKSYGVAGMLDNALRTYSEMETLKTPRSALSFNALLKACLNSKKFNRVPQLFDEMPAKYGFKPNVNSYGLLLTSFCDAGKPEKAIDKLKQLNEEGVNFPAITYTSIIHALYKKRKPTEAQRIWDEMVNKGCLIDVAANNVRLMNAVDGDPENIKAMIEEMSNAGLKPDIISYNYLMTCYCKKGMMNEAKEVYDKLEENCCIPNAVTFKTLVFYSCKNELIEMGYDIFKCSVAVDMIPDFGTTKFLVEGLVKKSRTEDAKEIIRTLKEKFPPNLLVGWTKVEKEFGLASTDTEATK